MKTTLELPDALFQEAKELAAKRGMPFRELVEISLRDHLQAAQTEPKPFKLGEAPSFHAEPLVDLSDWSAVKAIIREDRMP